MTSGGLSSVLTAYDQCVISLAIGYGVSWIHYSMLYGIMINPSMLDVHSRMFPHLSSMRDINGQWVPTLWTGV